MKFSREYIKKHKDCYTDSRIEYLAKLSGVEDEDEISLETILDSQMKLAHKTWFLFRHTKMTKIDIGIILIKILKVVGVKYGEYYLEDNINEIFELLESDLENKKTKLSAKVYSYRSELAKRLLNSENNMQNLERGMIKAIDVIEMVKKNKPLKEILNTVNESLFRIEKVIRYREEYIENIIDVLKTSVK